MQIHEANVSASLINVNSAARFATNSDLLNDQHMDAIEVTRRRRLAILIEEEGSQAALAEKIGKAPAQISQWIRALPDSKTGKPRSMSKEVAREIEGILGKPPGWMDQPIGGVDSVRNELLARPHNNHPSIPFWHAPDAIRVPIFANGGSMGSGDAVLDGDVLVGDLAISPHWVNQYIKPQNPTELRFIHAHGDSMNPTFSDGDVLLVDTGCGARDPSLREGIYVLQVSDRNYIKRVTPLFNGGLQVTSDNPSSKTVEVLNGDHQVQVLGRVVWAWRGQKL